MAKMFTGHTLRVPSIFSHNILAYLQDLSMSKWPFLGFKYQQFRHEEADAKGILKLQEDKTWKRLSNINMKC